MRDLIEARFDVSLDDPGKTSVHHLLTAEDRMMRASVGPKPVRTIMELCLVNWLKGHADGFLNDLVAKTRNAQASLFSVGLGNHHAPKRLRLISSTFQFQA